MLDTDKVSIGLKFKKYRKIKNLTQFQLAELVGLNEKQISRIEAGLNYPTYITFAKLLDALDIDISIFFDNEITVNKSQQNLISLIKKSKEHELNLYNDVIKSIKKHIKMFSDV